MGHHNRYTVVTNTEWYDHSWLRERERYSLRPLGRYRLMRTNRLSSPGLYCNGHIQSMGKDVPVPMRTIGSDQTSNNDPIKGSQANQQSKHSAHANNITKASGDEHPHDQPNAAHLASTMSFCHLASAAACGPSSCADHPAAGW